MQKKKIKINKSKGKDVLSILVKEFGDEVVWTKKQSDMPIEVLISDCLSIAWVLGRGGLPRGRIVEVSGQESSGKTTLCYHFMKCVQQQGGRCVFIDAENSIDLTYMRSCGVDDSKIVIIQPDYGEQALDIVEKVIDNGQTDLIVVDSVAALIPKAELEGEVTDMQIGLQARMMAKSMRRLSPALKSSKTVVMFTNQLRDKIGGFTGFMGPQTSTPGGRALKHAASVRIEIKKHQQLKTGTKAIGFMAGIKVIKNKVAPPFRDVEVPLIYGYGFDERLDLINLALSCRAIIKRSSVFYIKNKPIGDGWRESYNFIKTHERVIVFVTAKVTAMLDKKADLGLTDDFEK